VQRPDGLEQVRGGSASTPPAAPQPTSRDTCSPPSRRMARRS
jgi:hypothetical protein